MDNNLPIVVFNIGVSGNLKRVVTGESLGTLVMGTESPGSSSMGTTLIS
jgi:hypothetical protein